MEIIAVKELSKSFEYYTKELGVRNSIKNLLFRKTLIKEAVRDISFRIDQGEFVAFLGPNGAGKTTTLKMLSGILHPTSGSVSVMGYNPSERKNEFKRKFAIVMGQKSQLWWDLPAIESILLNKYIYQVEDVAYRKSLDELTELLQVHHVMNVQVRRLSLGERMKLELIASLIHKPQLLFLDEPTIGLDIETQKKVRDFLKYYNEQHKTTIVLTSHYMKDIEDLCSRLILISDGQLIYDGNLKEMNGAMNQTKVIKLKFTERVKLEQLQTYAGIRHAEDYQATLEIPKEQVNAVSRELLARLPIEDILIEDIPVEEMIVSMYQRKRAQ
ncbi:ABC-2 type transport system ATP-binding protein [Paenibacillus endophyticus]|uniref:ABC-2 type transport system ATP-binding protein n=1 Tax=Paenibacillus endophyticus TaxID=1294268 RepID=A0A7W5CAL3_9BACL|nr:ATP-binding cassette domain-containing protein [Paenibacillus endophyticus]MBB3154206.1 ABC-2 type transport system ATP-binding protein [Paenibacillus endophyticus]